ncbi:MAG TPA: tRNA (adenosine(37)-N6)-threonylcarbamoyltransferase complex dimerization subunit type 1 TsaB [Terriglobia bacterium]|nr:tRNA (adenosine(37)-N6)-threonylcarbamoyltransferase complex dimerization subunit type 1 TsaB [Terriglobia bacterium]
MRVLAVDTSSARGSAALSEKGIVLAETRLASSIQHSERLFASIEFIFRFAPFTLGDVDLFAATRGPGSFTGLRIGLAAMEGFAAAYGKPSAGVSTLEALAWQTGIEDAPVAAVIDARRGEVYAALYRRHGGARQGALQEELAPVAMPLGDWLERLPEGVIHFCGDGALRYRSLLTRETWRLHEGGLYLAGTVATMVETMNYTRLEPLYVRRTDAELARERRP